MNLDNNLVAELIKLAQMPELPNGIGCPYCLECANSKSHARYKFLRVTIIESIFIFVFCFPVAYFHPNPLWGVLLYILCLVIAHEIGLKHAKYLERRALKRKHNAIWQQQNTAQRILYLVLEQISRMEFKILDQRHGYLTTGCKLIEEFLKKAEFEQYELLSFGCHFQRSDLLAGMARLSGKKNSLKKLINESRQQIVLARNVLLNLEQDIKKIKTADSVSLMDNPGLRTCANYLVDAYTHERLITQNYKESGIDETKKFADRSLTQLDILEPAIDKFLNRLQNSS